MRGILSPVKEEVEEAHVVLRPAASLPWRCPRAPRSRQVIISPEDFIPPQWVKGWSLELQREVKAMLQNKEQNSV